MLKRSSARHLSVTTFNESVAKQQRVMHTRLHADASRQREAQPGCAVRLFAANYPLLESSSGKCFLASVMSVIVPMRPRNFGPSINAVENAATQRVLPRT